MVYGYRLGVQKLTVVLLQSGMNDVRRVTSRMQRTITTSAYMARPKDRVAARDH